MIAIHGARSYGLELKAPGGRPIELQLATITVVESADVFCCIAEGLDRALPVLETWGLVRGQAITRDKWPSR